MAQKGGLSPAFIAMILDKNLKEPSGGSPSLRSNVEPVDALPASVPSATQSYQVPSLDEMLGDAPLLALRGMAKPTGVDHAQGGFPIQVPNFEFGHGTGNAQPAAIPAQMTAGNNRLSLSGNGLAALKTHEGYKSKTYKDGAGYDTIGYGHKLTAGESYPHGIDNTQADHFLLNDTSTAQDAVRDNVTVPLSQNQFDALTSFAYNAGVGALRNSTLLTKLNQGDYVGASDELPKWNKITVRGKKVESKGLSNRRAAEKSLFDAP